MRRGRIILIGLVALVSSCASPPDKTQPPLSSRESDSEQPADTLVAIQGDGVNLLDGSNGKRIRTLVPSGENISVAWDPTRNLVIVGRSNGSFVELTDSTIFTVDLQGEKEASLLKVKAKSRTLSSVPAGTS